MTSLLVLRRAILASLKYSLIRNSVITPTCSIRLKHQGHILNRGQNKGKRQQQASEVKQDSETQALSDAYMSDIEYDTIASNAMHVSNRLFEQKIFVIQPYVKWGPQRSNVKPEHQLNEAEALVRSIPTWNIIKSMKIGLDSLDKQTLFGSGQLEQIKSDIQAFKRADNPVTAVFVSKGTLDRRQKLILESKFGVPVLDRYSVVVQILRLHATSAESKLQVAMAEIPYIWSQMSDMENSNLSRGQIYFTDAQKDMLKAREKRLKDELNRIRSQRVLLRRKRTKQNFPIVAVVGYTNAGKTSLIKALTNEESLQPRDQLFATLDVTSHAGVLPCNLEVLFMDTVGFMSDIPTGLIECFVSTLEDAMLADVIMHVQDIAHENFCEQKKHVEKTLEQLMQSIKESEPDAKLPPIINIANKVDLYQGDVEKLENVEVVSSKTLVGINDLMEKLETTVLSVTNRKKLVIKVRSGSEESTWLYKNTAVTGVEVDPKSSEHLLMHVVIAHPTLEQFKHKFITSRKSD